MEEIWNFLNCIYSFLNNNVAFNLLLWTLAILGFILDRVGLFKGPRTELPRYVTRSSNIINRLSSLTTSAITVSAGNEPINTLTITKLAFWNAGKKTLDKEIVAVKDPFTIKCAPGIRIIDYELQFANKANNVNLTLSPTRDSINVSFDYLAQKQGCVLKIYHTGESNTDIWLEGSIKTNHQIKRFVSNAGFCYSNKKYLEKFSQKGKGSNNNLETERRNMGCFLMLMAAAFIILYYTLIVQPTTIPNFHSESHTWGTIFASLVPAVIFFLGLILTRRRLPKDISNTFYNDK